MFLDEHACYLIIWFWDRFYGLGHICFGATAGHIDTGNENSFNLTPDSFVKSVC